MKTIVICGPTGSGKSALAVTLAQQFDGIIVNADSMQVYRELEILSSRPNEKDMRSAPHRLYGVMSMHQVCAVAVWRSMALGIIDTCQKAGKLPILCGGTGMYVRFLLDELSRIPDIPVAIRSVTRKTLEEVGNKEFKRLLVERDPISGRRIATGDSQRLARAWEVLEATGFSITYWHKKKRKTNSENGFYSVLLMPERRKLYSNCDTRFLEFIDKGAIDEAKRIQELDLLPGLPAFKALGLSELIQYLDGEIGLSSAIELAQRATRRYAKRQVTWFRNQLHEDYLMETQDNDEVKTKLIADITRFLEK